MTKTTPDLRIDRLGTHLFQVTRKDGSNFLKWHWETLEHEVRAAILDYESKQEKKAAKINIIAETEKKVTKSRAKKTDEVAKEVKKPAAKKPAAKKATTKKSK